MALIAFCSIGRGDEVCWCVRLGIAWVLQSGRMITNQTFKPRHDCRDKSCQISGGIRGYLVLFPSRKNRQGSPSWIPIASAAAIRMMSDHLTWPNKVFPSGCKYMFVPRRFIRKAGKRASSGEPFLLYATYTDPGLHIYAFFASLYVATIHLLKTTIRRFLVCVYAPPK